MPQEKQKNYRLPVEQLYPELSPGQLAEAEYFLTKYLEVIFRITVENSDLTGSDLNTRFKPP